LVLFYVTSAVTSAGMSVAGDRYDAAIDAMTGILSQADETYARGAAA